MKRTLIVPDVHEELARLQQVKPLIKQAGRVVWLGDFWDTFKTRHIEEICDEVKEALERGDDVLIGNHCTHYHFKHAGYGCSGFELPTRVIVNSRIMASDVNKLKVYTEVGKFTVSHAGFHLKTLHYKQAGRCEKAIKSSLDGEYDALFGAGRARGGSQLVGGPVWLDWNQEFKPIKGMPQIVGHTRDNSVRTKKIDSELSYCLDTGLKHVMWVNEETNEVEVVTL